ncbi:cytochrome aa3 quinol oxidase subunit II [Listeria monocytogenes]|nr:cytochrome aa3 quinol oxidase subunit II [Listeria monocytogenes]EAC8842254.1 cytochrome aa3 quinol oxidase subunit II [Listeria monocytogenes]EAD0270644.1 cytochrome aa3 quinol oxidase subunit II [Listeria monocytogenes]EAD0291438.1 cytochrome aa3 quinol oxidase subunit II [Listeria monocytogenes]EAD0421375.1 cytochrome aa3 quinol oxidase subunit II [Listeria monocytogenes]
MSKVLKSLLLTALLGVTGLISGCGDLTVLNPKGPVAKGQSDLIIYSIIFMLVIVLTIFVLFTIMLVKYRERKDISNYEPDMHGSKKLEIFWTLIPVAIVIALAIPTVKTIYAGEEAPKVTSHKDPIIIYATSADWKWIFSYPDESIETVNYVNIPTDRPVLFKLTSADTMTSFWVPQLGGQKYAMSGMTMNLYLQADEVGTYKGRNANFNGEGFADQRFDVVAQSEKDFKKWAKETKTSSPVITQDIYDRLLIPGSSKQKTYSGTHLAFVDVAADPEYVFYAYKRFGYEMTNPHNPNTKSTISDKPMLPVRPVTVTNPQFERHDMKPQIIKNGEGYHEDKHREDEMKKMEEDIQTNEFNKKESDDAGK